MSWIRGFEHFLRENEPLAPYTWLRLGGPAKFFAEPTTVEELSTLVKRCHEQGIAARMLGGGSNILVDDAGVDGLVIHLTAACFADVQRKGNTLRVGGGAKLAHLVAVAAREGFVGMEDLVGIPGSVGGALHGNTGGVRDDIGSWARSATVITRSGETMSRNREELHFAYRSSSLDELIILDASFEMETGDAAEITKRMQRNWIVKRASLPPSATPQGCVFKVAAGTAAATVIEQAGLARLRVGDAELSDHNANFVLIGRSGTSAHVRELIATVQRTVAERLGIQIETALEVW